MDAMTVAYLDGSAGISGDMLLGALVDAGVDPAQLIAELKKLPLADYDIRTARVMRRGIVGTKVDIEVAGKQPHRHLSYIERIIGESTLSECVKQGAIAIFRRLGEAEAKLHNQPIEKVHFHEVGAVDSILDTVGACVGLEMLGIATLISSPLNLGAGRVDAAHGSLPVPAPATAELLRGVPVYSSGCEGELVTPTGAAVVSTVATGFGPLPPMKIERIGYGAGSKDFPTHPNLARLFVGTSLEPGEVQDLPFVPSNQAATARVATDPTAEVISVIEANVDDMNPQLYGYLVDRVLVAGALDITSTAVQMKKNRPGMLITVLCAQDSVDAVAQILFTETTTLGVRIHEARRKVLDRESVKVETEYGAVSLKLGRMNGKVLNAAPEYEDCRRIASERGVPLKQVMLAALTAYDKVSSEG
jgi:uncharacterized protein (TIGR00299 family) protein